MAKITNFFIILSLILSGGISHAETAIELQGDDAFFAVSDELNQLNTDVDKALATSETARKNLFSIYGPKSKQAAFGRMDPESQLKAAPFLARVGSDYFDEVTKKWMTVSGMGTLVTLSFKNDQGQTKQQLAVLTASHVSQGTRLRVKDVNGRNLPVMPGLRLANVDEDVEIIFLQGDAKSALSYDEKNQVFATRNYDLNREWTEQTRPINYASFDVSMRNHVAVLVQDIPNLKAALGGFDWYHLNEASQPLKGSTIKEKSRFIWDNFGSLQKPLVGHGWMSSSKMPPGLSGAPLINDRPSSQLIEAGLFNMRLDGIVLAQHRSQKKTFYTDATVIRELVQKIRKGERSFTSPTRWRLASGLTFRDYGNGKLEAAFTTRPSANFSRMDSGNASSIDSGNASSIDSGNASSIDSGNASSIDSGNASSIDSGNASSIDSGSGTSQSGIQLLWGSQEGYGKKVVGHIIKKGGQSLAVVSTPFVEKDAATLGFSSVETISGNTDLYKLLKLKSQYVNHKEPMRFDLPCFYKVSDKGLLIAVYHAREISDVMGNRGLERELFMTIELSREKLAKGLFANTLRYEGNVNVDITGFFITDFSAIYPSSGIEGVLGPSVVISTNEGRGVRVGCYKTSTELAQAVTDYANEVTLKAQRNMRSYYMK
jgi:hypothetical protein